MRILHKKLLLAISGILLLSYGIWQARDFLAGPRVHLESPEEGVTLETGLLAIRGEAFDIVKLSLNGRTIFTDENGNFEEELLLAPGVNLIEIHAQDKFGHEFTIRRTVLLN